MTKIMLVEDDNNLREIYEARLSAEGYEIVSAQDGEAALALAGKEKPDMIISDVMMPKISGFEMLDILRNTDSLRNVKIIMLTALGQTEDNERANSLGADRYLVKSQVTLEDIVKAAHELLDDPTVVAPSAATPTNDDTDDTTGGTNGQVTDDTASADSSLPTDAPTAAVIQTPSPTLDTNPSSPSPTSEPSTSSAPITAIPVVDADDSSIVPSEPADSASSAPISIQVVEPPSDDTDNPSSNPNDSDADQSVEPAPATFTDTNSSPAPAQPSPDIAIAPESLTDAASVTPEPSVVISEEHVEQAAPQGTAAEEATIKAQIDDFISSQAALSTDQDEAPQTPEPAEIQSNSPSTEAETAPVAEVVTQPEAAETPETQVPVQAVSDAEATPVAPATDNAPFPSLWGNTQQSVDTFASSESRSTPAQAPIAPISPVSVANTRDAADADFEPEPEMLNLSTAPVITPASPTSETTEQAAPEANPPATATQEDSAALQYELTDVPTPTVSTDAITPTEETTDVQPDVAAQSTTMSADTDQLLALQEAKMAAAQAAASSIPAQPNIAAYNPNTQAAPETPLAPPSTPSSDPNSISL